ncbi:MAG: prenyltransferase/squalene oxidase repeat-containing protein [Thermoguttaceae bacterium]|jgi:hypothetical protein
MTEDIDNTQRADVEEVFDDERFSVRFMDWVRTELIWYAGSFTIHLLGLALLLLLGSFSTQVILGDAPSIEEVPVEQRPDEPDPPPPQDIVIPKPPPEPTIDEIALLIKKILPETEPTGEYSTDIAGFEQSGGGAPLASTEPSLGGGGFPIICPGPGPKVVGPGGVGPGNGGDGGSLRRRSTTHHEPGTGVTKQSERTVAGALFWLALHQMTDGRWSCNHLSRCKDQTCTGPGSAQADVAATALGLLPFLAAGQTHRSKGPYRNNIQAGLAWLIRNQKADGNLASGSTPLMYAHGLATIALCEAYGLTGDSHLGMAAQRAVDFIQAAQNKNTGGWRYNPGDPGDTSVFGWEVMALKSAHMCGLQLGQGSASPFQGAGKWLDLVAQGSNKCQYSYLPEQGPSNTMTSVGLLCRQYLGARRGEPMMVDGVKYLMTQLPDRNQRNIYYWYYATQVLHNYTGYEWDTWNRAMRKLLIETQVKDPNTCANGSWDPDKPAHDQWAHEGGRLMETALSALTLEIYYRYLPLYKIDADQAVPGGGHADAKGDDAAKAAVERTTGIGKADQGKNVRQDKNVQDAAK